MAKSLSKLKRKEGMEIGKGTSRNI